MRSYSPMRRQSPKGKEREAELRRVRPAVEKRAGYVCESCGKRDTHNLHHVMRRLPLGKSSDNLALLVVICDDCHREAHEHPNAGVDLELQLLAVLRLTGKPCPAGEWPVDVVRRFFREAA